MMSAAWDVFNAACWFVVGFCAHSIRVNRAEIRRIKAEMAEIEQRRTAS